MTSLNEQVCPPPSYAIPIRLSYASHLFVDICSFPSSIVDCEFVLFRLLPKGPTLLRHFCNLIRTLDIFIHHGIRLHNFSR